MANVTVGCKLPNGLIIKLGTKSALLNGSNSSRIVGGYGLTEVDKDFFEAWAKQFADYPPLKNDLIFVQDSAKKAQGQATEQADIKTGLEPIDPLATGIAGVKAELFEGKPVDKDD